jgi:cell division protein FtsW
VTKISLVLTVSLIFALGLVMIFDTTSAEVLDLSLDKSLYQALLRQLGYGIVGATLAYTVFRVGYRSLIDWSPVILMSLVLLLILCFVPGIGRAVNGSKRWVNLGGFTLQPSEFVKYFVPAYFILYLRRFGGVITTFKDFLRILAILSIPMVLILIEPNNGTVGVIGVTMAVLFGLSEVPLKFWAIPILAMGLIGGAIALNLPYVQARLKVYLDPELDIRGKGHQPYQAKIAAGSGRFLGKGVGNSLQKLSYLPEAQNDYIAAIYAEETGFLGTLILIFMYMVIALIGFSIAYRAPDIEGRYFASIVTFLITFQAFLNLGVVSGLLPSTGLNLPFFSQGGSSLIANMMGIGILLSTERHTRHMRTKIV